VLVNPGASHGADALGVDQILDGKGDAVKRPQGLPFHDGSLGLPGLIHGGLEGQCTKGVDVRVKRLDPPDEDRYDFHRGHGLQADHPGQIHGASITDLFLLLW
jgi:hypothetical protein